MINDGKDNRTVIHFQKKKLPNSNFSLLIPNVQTYINHREHRRTKSYRDMHTERRICIVQSTSTFHRLRPGRPLDKSTGKQQEFPNRFVRTNR